MVRSHLDYCSSVWAPYKKRKGERLSQRCRKKATKILPALKNLSYSEILKICQKTTLHYRRIRGDMMETYKIVTRKYETCVAPSLSKVGTYVTRGNDLRLKKFRVKYDLRKYSFFLSEWSIYGIVCLTGFSDTTDTFKARLDKFWHNQDIVYNFRAQLQGTGRQSFV